MALTDKLTAIADAIRAKTGKSETMTLDAMPSEIAGIAGTADIDALIDGEITEITSYANEIKPYCFYQCYHLTKADLPVLTSMRGAAFNACYTLRAVILRNNKVCTLVNVSAFNYCYHFHGTVSATYNPEGLKDGYIYVPAALIDSYRTASNWSSLDTQFRALEEYTVDGTTTGELDETKI